VKCTFPGCGKELYNPNVAGAAQSNVCYSHARAPPVSLSQSYPLPSRTAAARRELNRVHDFSLSDTVANMEIDQEEEEKEIDRRSPSENVKYSREDICAKVRL
jgi:hypothetical protein